MSFSVVYIVLTWRSYDMGCLLMIWDDLGIIFIWISNDVHMNWICIVNDSGWFRDAYGIDF